MLIKSKHIYFVLPKKNASFFLKKITLCVLVSKRHLSPFMYKTAKCLPDILLDAETDWRQLNYNLYIWLCIIVSSYCVCI